MAKYKFIFLLTAINTLVYQLNAQCRLTKEQVAGEKRVFAQLRPYLEDTVDIGSSVYMVCNDGDVLETKCRIDGTFERAIPTNDCVHPMKVQVEAMGTLFTPNCTLYRVGYKSGEMFLELYRTCYNAKSLTAHFSRETAYAYSVANSRPNAQFTTDGILSGADAATFQADKVYQRFEQLLGTNQPYITNKRDAVIHRGHLTPSADYLFPDAMKATFKYINVVPQFGSINTANWKKIESWTRSYLQLQNSATIITGGLGVLELRSSSGQMVPMYLAAPDRNPIPKWIYKLIIDNSIHIAFVTYNNIYEDSMPPAICSVQQCPISFTQNKRSGFTYCCDAHELAVKYLNYL